VSHERHQRPQNPTASAVGVCQRLAIKMDPKSEPVDDIGYLNGDVWKGWIDDDNPRGYRK